MVRLDLTSEATPAPALRAAPEVSKPTLVSVGTGLAVAGLVLISPPPDRLPLFVGAAGYLLFAIESDVRCLRIPNWLNATGLVLALGLAGGLGGMTGIGAALLGAGVALAIGFALFALGILGAGDAKGLTVLGALFGLSAFPGVLSWTVLVAGALGIALLLVRGEILDFLQRWWLMALALLVTRKPTYVSPAAGSAAATGLPFAVAMGLGTAANSAWGAPWTL